MLGYKGLKVNIEEDDHVNNSQQKDYFTGAQRRRIAAQIRDGIEPEEARRREKIRYAKALEDQKAGILVQARNKVKGERSADNSPAAVTIKADEYVNKPQQKDYFTGAQKRRIAAQIWDGIDPEEARRREKARYAKVLEERERSAGNSPAKAAVMIEGDDYVNKAQQKDYFTGAQKRRIAAQIRDGIEPEEARRREKARYAKVLANKEAGILVQATTNRKREWSADNSPARSTVMIEGDDYVNIPQQKDYFTGAQRRRIAAQIRDGIEPEEARRREKARYAKVLAEERERSADNFPAGPAPKKHRAHVETRPSPSTSKQDNFFFNHGREDAYSRPSTSGGSYRDATAQCKIAIVHLLHPFQTLTERETKLVKKSVLEEMDKRYRNCPAIKFVAVSDRDGCLSFTCHDTETKKWLMSTAEKIKPWHGAKLRVIQVNDIPKQHVCITYVPEDDNLTKDIFLNRIGKQNTNLNTKDWRVLSIVKESGGYHVTFSVDEQSKDSILKSKCKLFLNFSQIEIRIKGSSIQENYGTQEEGFITPQEANNDAPVFSGSTVEELMLSLMPVNPIYNNYGNEVYRNEYATREVLPRRY
ncbi:uncharacterized protein LOC129912781 isoform X1 [Episyrphus balteatus]|uniref:uncharacterized protein LOC129912781 isoform X1 n=1 Tax=Episyrphus balteatus TaxID=286459 RepID=UPI00248661CC|nr:uncharacterized protein LOC129912781 isoform X1 [Episyrphus balteatus]XP_055847170.1 uncharacterized protein LOC129912781 isoform X1 [Episyrphus balteatus]XP_055847171.1 uncharacterized protein LOC129912781 isoform X1 [Episyrphus balteatus]